MQNFKIAAVRHLGFVMRMFGPSTKGLWRITVTKILWNRCGSFYNMQGLIFCELGSKTPFHAPKIGVWGAKYGGRGDAMLTPANSFLLLGVVTSVTLLAKIDEVMRP